MIPTARRLEAELDQEVAARRLRLRNAAGFLAAGDRLAALFRSSGLEAHVSAIESPEDFAAGVFVRAPSHDHVLRSLTSFNLPIDLVHTQLGVLRLRRYDVTLAGHTINVTASIIPAQVQP